MQLCQWITITAQGEVDFDGGEKIDLRALQAVFSCFGAILRAARWQRKEIWRKWCDSCEASVREAKTILVKLLPNDTEEDQLISSWLLDRNFDKFVSEALSKLVTPVHWSSPCEAGGTHRVTFDATGAPFCQRCERPISV